MAFDTQLAETVRRDLAHLPGISEKRMFGGLCFLWHGNMLCGVDRDGLMYRVGKDNEADALAIDGAAPMQFTGRKMGGFIEVDEDAAQDSGRRQQWLDLALTFVGGLPAK